MLRASLLGIILAGKEGKRSKIPEQGAMRAGERVFRAGQDF